MTIRKRSRIRHNNNKDQVDVLAKGLWRIEARETRLGAGGWCKLNGRLAKSGLWMTAAEQSR